jgi:hypothetical protein
LFHIKRTSPDVFDKLELYFTDTGTELVEVYEYLEKIENTIGRKIERIKAYDKEQPFDYMLFDRYKGFLPAPQARWCTRELKIMPMEKWIGKTDKVISYVGLRADEPEREGYVGKGKNPNITPVYPFREDGITIDGVYAILDETVGLPEYYKWRTRSGCYFCFYQRRVEFAVLNKLYPDLFMAAKQYETEHSDGRKFTWIKGKPLEYIEESDTQIISRYVRKQYKKVSEEYRKSFVLSLDEMIELIEQDRIREFIDTWDLKRLHDVDGENKDGCVICVI